MISDEIYHGLDYAFAAECAARLSPDAIVINSFSKYFCMTGWRIGWMVVPPALVRPVERLQQNLAISVPTLSQIAAEAAFDGRAELEEVRRGYEANRGILLEGLPRAGLASFLPADGAFYLYADISRFSNDSFAFATRLLEQAGVAATPGWISIRSTAAISCGYAMRERAPTCRKPSRASAIGCNTGDRHEAAMSEALFDILRKVTTATITTMLLKKGIRRCWMNGPKPLVARGERIVGPAFTLRFVPVREDVATPESWGHRSRPARRSRPCRKAPSPSPTPWASPAPAFSATFCARACSSAASPRSSPTAWCATAPASLTSGLPVWSAGVAAPASVNGLTFVGWKQPIGCGGCAVFPGDVIVADDDGAVVIPPALADFVAREGAEHELMETWLVQEVEKGAKLPGLYPPNDENKKRYAQWRKTRS